VRLVLIDHAGTVALAIDNAQEVDPEKLLDQLIDAFLDELEAKNKVVQLFPEG
jgi:hypothetical protein